MANRLPIEEQITFLYTRDLERTATFYEQILGLPLVRDQGDCRIYRVTVGASVGFCQRVTAPREPQGIIFTLITPDVDGWHAALQARGVTFEKPPELNPKYNIYHCFLRDPNGYLIEIQRFCDPE
mgnify:CR=1 FL=1